MQVRIFELGDSPTISFTGVVLDKPLTIGTGESCDVVVPESAAEIAAEVVRTQQATMLKRLDGATVSIGGRELPVGERRELGPEVLVRFGDRELVFALTPTSADVVFANSDEASPAAMDALKKVYAALGVPEDFPALIVYDEAGQVSSRFDLKPGMQALTIGRLANNDIVLHHKRISKQHVRISSSRGGLTVEDLRSRNGTELNGVPLKGSRPLKSGDRLSMGPFVVRYVDPKKAAENFADNMPDLASRRSSEGRSRSRSASSASDEAAAVPPAVAQAGSTPTKEAARSMQPVFIALLIVTVLAVAGLVTWVVLQ